MTPMNGPSRNFGEAIESYSHLFTDLESTNSQGLDTIAKKTIELNQLAAGVISAASPALRKTAEDLKHLLSASLRKGSSILHASEHYPSTSELADVIRELTRNPDALALMCQEFKMLSTELKNPNGPVN